MVMKKRAVSLVIFILIFLAVALLVGWLIFRAAFPRPHRETVEASGVEPSLVYAVIRAESSYREDVVSSAGAVGLMQIKPSTAEFVCGREGIPFDMERLKEGEYNIVIGTRYLLYLMERFQDEASVLAAYNAGEGTVRQWLSDSQYSSDGVILQKIPYPETDGYIKKVRKFKKIYEFLYS